MRILKYPTTRHHEHETKHTESNSEFDRRLQQLLLLATALSTEIEALKAQLAAVVGAQRAPTPIRRPFAIT